VTSAFFLELFLAKNLPPISTEKPPNTASIAKSHMDIPSLSFSGVGRSRRLKRLKRAVIKPPRTIDTAMYTGIYVNIDFNSFFLKNAATHKSAQTAISTTNAQTRPTDKNRAQTAYIPPSTAAIVSRSALNFTESIFAVRKKHKKSMLKFIIKYRSAYTI